MFTTAEKVPDVCILGYHISSRAKNIRLGDKVVPTSGPYTNVPVKVLRIERREVLVRGRFTYQFYFYCNKV